MKDSATPIGYTELPAPSKAEVEIAIEKLSEKYHSAISYDDATKFVTLSKTLEMWREIEKDIEDGKAITKKDAKVVQRYFKVKGEPVSLERASIETEKGLITNITAEVMRLTNELEALVNKYR